VENFYAPLAARAWVLIVAELMKEHAPSAAFTWDSRCRCVDVGPNDQLIGSPHTWRRLLQKNRELIASSVVMRSSVSLTR